MKIYFKTLSIYCKKSIEEINLSHRVSFFHGKVSSGKSTIARLIDFCMSGKLENTPAINKEFLKAKLLLHVGEYDVIIERAKNDNDIMVIWTVGDDIYRINAPIDPSPSPIFSDNIYSFSDLIFYFWDMDVLKTPKSNKSDSMLQRLSIRNFFWYCYLKQDKLDSSFYRFEEPYNLRTTRQTFRFILGYISQKLTSLESKLVKVKEQKSTKKSTIEELNSFLYKFKITESDLDFELQATKNNLSEAEKMKSELQQKYMQETHGSDKKRIKLIKTGNAIQKTEIIINDLQNKINSLHSLRAELISSLYKIDRSISSNKIFTNQKFEKCPCCGEDVIYNDSSQCYLCKQEKTKQEDTSIIFEIAKIDTEARIKDIENSVDNQKKQLESNKILLKKHIQRKKQLDAELDLELKNYESAYLSNIRNIEGDIAMYRERVRNLLRTSALPKEISVIEKEVLDLETQDNKLTEQIREEYLKINKSDSIVGDLEKTFAETLKTVGVPGIEKDDTVTINRKDWSVKITPPKDVDLDWGFYEAGSGGKKTLLNVCFLLSIHIVAEKYNLDLPSFMIIDTPMKNIDREVNQDLFKNFYDYLYSLINNELLHTQVIIIDNAMVKPNDPSIDFYDRYLTPDDPDNPPLISYYRGA